MLLWGRRPGQRLPSGSAAIGRTSLYPSRRALSLQAPAVRLGPPPDTPTGQQELAQAGAPSVSTLSICSFDPRGHRQPASAVGAEPQTLRGHIGTGRRTAVRMRASRRQFCVRGARERCNHCPEGSRRWAETAGKTSRRRRALSRAGQVVCAGWVNGG